MTAEHSSAAKRIRILMVDDHPAVREGLALLVSLEGMEICAEADKRAEALARVTECHPDLAIVDLSLDGEDGLLVVADLKARGLPALGYSVHSDTEHVEGAFAAGALGYVTKSEFRGVLVEAIHEVSAGRRFVSPRAAVALVQRLDAARADDVVLTLSGREAEVYRMLGEGEGTYEIAAAMKISTHTVESYYARLQHKLDLHGMYHLRHHAIEHVRRHS
jgi:DNA-binding NarL/FixJ family response regulator